VFWSVYHTWDHVTRIREGITLPKPDDQLATPEEVAEALHVNTTTLAQQRYRRIGLPYIRVGRAVRYRWADVEAYLQARTITPGGAA
jgi:Helix-turn-helix domain